MNNFSKILFRYSRSDFEDTDSRFSFSNSSSSPMQVRYGSNLHFFKTSIRRDYFLELRPLFVSSNFLEESKIFFLKMELPNAPITHKQKL